MQRRALTLTFLTAALLLASVATLHAAAGRVSLAPARFQPVEVRPGETHEVTLKVENGTDAPVELRAYALGLVGSARPGTLAAPAERGTPPARAASWVTFPTLRSSRTLAPGEVLRFPARVDVPSDAQPGTTTLGIAVSRVVSARGTVDDEQPGSRVRLSASLASTLVLRIPGDVDPSVRIRDVVAPRVLWGGQPGRLEVEVENDGNVDLTLGTEAVLASRLGGARTRLRPSDEATWLLPAGRAKLRLTWNDRPWLGWYEPRVVVTDETNDVAEERTMPAVLVLPPWWVLALLALAVALASWRGRRRRRTRRHRADGRVSR